MKIEVLNTSTSRLATTNKDRGDIRDSGLLGAMIPMDVSVEIP